jgi:Bromodomain
MDLGTITTRLKHDHYANPLEVLEDVRLVWRNCRTFNEPGSDVYKACDELAGYFDQLWKQARLEVGKVRGLRTGKVRLFG